MQKTTWKKAFNILACGLVGAAILVAGCGDSKTSAAVSEKPVQKQEQLRLHLKMQKRSLLMLRNQLLMPIIKILKLQSIQLRLLLKQLIKNLQMLRAHSMLFRLISRNKKTYPALCGVLFFLLFFFLCYTHECYYYYSIPNNTTTRSIVNTPRIHAFYIYIINMI